MEIKIDKKFFIQLGIVIILCCSCFFAGRFLKFRGSSKLGADAQQQAEQITARVTNLETELEQRIRECESLEQQLSAARSGIDECLGIAGHIRIELEEFRNENTGTNSIVVQLRKRIIYYENRIRELEEILRSVETGTPIK